MDHNDAYIDQVYTAHTQSALMPNNGAATPPQVISIRNNVHRIMNSDIEFHSRASSETTSLWLSKILSVNGIERSEEQSDAMILVGPAVEQALALFSTEVEERQQVPLDTIVNRQNKARGDVYVPSHSAAFTRPTSAPTTPSVLHMCTVALCQCPNEPILLLEIVSRQHEPSGVCKTMEVHGLHSPGLEAAQKQSVTSVLSSSVEGEGQLARAAAYIQEHIERHSLASDEFPRCSSKEPPDKQLIVVNKEMKAGSARTSPVCSEGVVKRERHPAGHLAERNWLHPRTQKQEGSLVRILSVREE